MACDASHNELDHGNVRRHAAITVQTANHLNGDGIDKSLRHGGGLLKRCRTLDFRSGWRRRAGRCLNGFGGQLDAGFAAEEQ